MELKIAVPDYLPERSLRMEWEPGAIIETRIDDGATVIRANQEGLVSFARLFLTLANEQVPSGSHWHLDESNSLEEGSTELIVEKM
jgi:hypothetical protein